MMRPHSQIPGQQGPDWDVHWGFCNLVSCMYMSMVHAGWGPVTANLIDLDLGCGWPIHLLGPGSFGEQRVLYALKPLITFALERIELVL